MAVWIKLDADHAVRACDGACALQNIAFHIVIAVSHHGTVQAKQQTVQRQRGTQLLEHFVAHRLVVGPVDRARRAGSEATPLNQGKAILGSTLTRHKQRRGAHARCIVWMLARAQKHALPEGLYAGGQRRESVGLGGNGG